MTLGSTMPLSTPKRHRSAMGTRSSFSCSAPGTAASSSRCT
jgi:hypothetical protein